MTGHLGNEEGPWLKALADFLGLSIEDEPGCGVLSCHCCFHSKLETLPVPSHPTWDFKSSKVLCP